MRMLRIAVIGCVVVVTLTVAGTGVEAQKGKPAPPNPNWICSIAFRDADGDMIRSDTRGPYVHGAEQVTCEIYTDGGGNPKFKLHFRPDSKSTRRLRIEGGSTVEGFEFSAANTLQPDYFEVVDLKTAVPVYDGDGSAIPAVYLRPFRVSKDGATFFFRGNSINRPEDPWYADTNGASSVFVQPLSNCSWDMWFDPDADGPLQVDASGRVVGPEEAVGLETPLWTPTGQRLLLVYERIRKETVHRGYVAMPFAARVTIVTGGASCTP